MHKLLSNPAESELSGQGDGALLARYAVSGSESVFAELVARHLPSVLAMARRQLGDPHQAEDLAQTVFIVLAKKARSLSSETVLPAWLCRVTFLSCREVIRWRARSLKRERWAADTSRDCVEDSPLHCIGNAEESQRMLAQLDAAMSQLGTTDYKTVTMRFIQDKPFAEIGRDLGLSESAASKRLNRALVKLRGLLEKRGVAVDGTGLVSALSMRAPAIPPALAAHVTSSALAYLNGSAVGGSTLISVKQVIATTEWAKIKVVGLTLATLLLTGIIIWLALRAKGGPDGVVQTVTAVSPPKPSPLPEAAPLPDTLAYKAVAVNDLSLMGMPYLRGWPLALPGDIVATPVVADMEGTGHLDVLVPCELRNTQITHVHPLQNKVPLLFAFRSDGTPVPGWPRALGGPNQGTQPQNVWGGWACSPSVFRDKDGKDAVVERAPGGAGVFIFRSNGVVINKKGANGTPNIPLADLTGNGVLDIFVAKVLCTVDGDPVPGWSASRVFRNGYGSCVGDAAGDGHLRLYNLFYTTPNTPYADVEGFDVHGNRLPGWPQKIDDPSWLPPVMGDVTGDGKMDIIATYGTHLFGWTYEGKPLPNTTTDGPLIGIIKANVFAATACPALADLDGDGVAEIIIFDSQTHSIRAWHGDGRPLAATDPAAIEANQAIDGCIATLPEDAHGISVVSLGDDPQVMDFFAGRHWVRRFPDGRTTITPLVPDNADATVEWTQPTVADLEGNGKADVIFGLTDGRLFVYQTGLACHLDRMQWPTANGNFQHTGAWSKRPTAGRHP